LLATLKLKLNLGRKSEQKTVAKLRSEPRRSGRPAQTPAPLRELVQLQTLRCRDAKVAVVGAVNKPGLRQQRPPRLRPAHRLPGAPDRKPWLAEDAAKDAGIVRGSPWSRTLRRVAHHRLKQLPVRRPDLGRVTARKEQGRAAADEGTKASSCRPRLQLLQVLKQTPALEPVPLAINHSRRRAEAGTIVVTSSSKIMRPARVSLGRMDKARARGRAGI
jgi:hypothetical protein